MSLPSAWVDRIHGRLLVRYGAAWVGMWKGVEPEAVKADWAHVLGGLSPESIAHGLDNLPPDRPPTVLQFRDICRGRSPAAVPALTHDRPPPNPQRLAEVMSRLQSNDVQRLVEITMDRLRTARETGTDPATGRPVSIAQLDFINRAEAALGRGEGAP